MAMAQPQKSLSPPRPQLQRANASAHPVLQGNNDYGAEGFGRGGMRQTRLPFMAIAEAASQSAGTTPLASPTVLRDNPMLRAESGSGTSGPRMPSRFEAMRASPMDMFRSVSSDTQSSRPTLRSKLSRKDLKEAAKEAASGSRSTSASPLPPTTRSRSASTSSGKSGRVASSSSLVSSASASSHASSSSMSRSRTSESAIDEDDADGWAFKCKSTTHFDQQRMRLMREKTADNTKRQQQSFDALFLALSQSFGNLINSMSEQGLGVNHDLASPTFRPEKPDDNHFLDFSQYICPLPSIQTSIPSLSIPTGQTASESLHGERTPRPTDYHRFAEHEPNTAQSAASSDAHAQACPVLLQPAPRERSFSTSGRRPSLTHLQMNTPASDGKRRSPPTAGVQTLPCLPDWAKADNRLHQERLMSQSRSSSRSSEHNDVDAARSLRPTQMQRAVTDDMSFLHMRDNPMVTRKQPFQRSHTLDVPASEQNSQAGVIVVPRPQRPMARVSPPQSMRAAANNETPRANRTQQWTHTPGSESFDSSSASDSGTSSDWSSVPQTPVSRVQGLHDAATIRGAPQLSSTRLPQSDSEIIDLFMASQGEEHDSANFGLHHVKEEHNAGQLPAWMRSTDLSPSRATPRAEFHDTNEYPHFITNVPKSKDDTPASLPFSTSRTSNASISPAKSHKFLPSAVFNSQDSQLTVRGVGELIARTTTPQQRHVLGRPRALSSVANNVNAPTDYSKERDTFRAALSGVTVNEQGLPESPSRTSSLGKALRRHRQARSDARQSTGDAASIMSEKSSHSTASTASDAASIMSDASSSSTSSRAAASSPMGSLLSYMRTSPKARVRAPSSASSSVMSQSHSANGSISSARRLAAAVEERS